MTLTASQLTESVALVTKYINDRVPDLMTNANYVLNMMMKRKKYVSGGENIQMPINDAELAAQGFIDGQSGVININQNRQFTYGTLDWKFFYHVIAITLMDLTKTQNTPLAIKDLLMAKTAAAKSSVTRTLGAALWASGDASNHKFNGFADIFAASGTAYAGILDTDVSAWLTEIDSATQVINYSNISGMIGTLEERIQQLGEQANEYAVDVMVSRQRVITKFKASEQIKQRYYDKEKVKAGFKGIEVDGKFWYPDANAPGTAATADNWLNILSTQSFELFYKYGLDGKKSPVDTQQIVPNQPVDINVSYFAGNIGCNNRRVNGVFKTLKA